MSKRRVSEDRDKGEEDRGLPRENKPQLHTEPDILRETIAKVLTQEIGTSKDPLLGPEGWFSR